MGKISGRERVELGVVTKDFFAEFGGGRQTGSRERLPLVDDLISVRTDEVGEGHRNHLTGRSARSCFLRAPTRASASCRRFATTSSRRTTRFPAPRDLGYARPRRR